MKYSTPEICQLGSSDAQEKSEWVISIVVAPIIVVVYPGPMTYLIAGY